MAESGNADSLRLLATTSINLVRRLNQLVRLKLYAKTLLPLSRKSEVWPVLLGVNETTNRAEAGILGSLQLAQGLERNFSSKAKWSDQTMAASFWREIDDVRTRFAGTIAPSLPILSKKQAEALLKTLVSPTIETCDAENVRSKSTIASIVEASLLSKDKLKFIRDALALPPFDQPGASKQWADLAKDRVVRQMKTSKEFHAAIIAELPRSKQKGNFQSWLTTEFRRKFASMSKKPQFRFSL